jgi:hypothetical protein
LGSKGVNDVKVLAWPRGNRYEGIFLGDAEDTADQILRRLDALADRRGEAIPATGAEQYQRELARAGF